MSRTLPLIACLLLAPAAAQAQRPAVRADVPGFRIVASDTLPAPPRGQDTGDGFCTHLQRTPQTAAGRHAASLGWFVTSEASLAGYTAVGIFSRGQSATSGTCLVGDGNVVLYRGDRPVAIVYEPPHGDDAGSIGGVVPTLSSDRLRISDFTPAGFESADLLLGPDSVAVVPIAAMETACGGVALPNLRGKTVPEARKLLAPHGWRPAGEPEQDPSDFDAARAFRKQGLTEYETCSGTGYGFCSVRYAHPGGAVLHVTTIGDDSTVSTYGVDCPKGG